MERTELEKHGLTKEQINFVLAEHDKAVKSEQDKAKTAQETAVREAAEKAAKPLNEQIAKHLEHVKELEEKIKTSAGVDEKSKKEIEDLQKAHEASLKELQNKAKEAEKTHASELAKLKRETETREFFAGLGKKFITPETQKAFEQQINEALADKAYEGRNRADILAILTKDKDGKERTDIYAAESTAKPGATGQTGGLPTNDSLPKKPAPTII